MTNNMNDIITAAEQAARQSDRVLLVAVIITAGLAWMAALRWFLADRKAVADRLTAITDRHIAQGEKLAEVVATNTKALEEIRSVIANCPNAKRL